MKPFGNEVRHNVQKLKLQKGINKLLKLKNRALQIVTTCLFAAQMIVLAILSYNFYFKF